MTAFEAIIVGGGHNGLTCAAYLARAGLDVCVLERRHVLGGACVTEEVWPGQRVSRASYVVSMLQPKIVSDLRLTDHGYQPIPLDPSYATFGPDGRPILFSADPERTPTDPGVQLTERELQVLRGMSQGKSNGQIGRELYLSEDTVKTHARRLFRKLGVRDRAQAVAHGFRRGLVS